MNPFPSDRAQVAELVCDVVSGILPGIVRDEITEDRHPKDLGADSVDRVEIIMALIDRSGSSRPMGDFSDLPHLGALIDLLTADARAGASR